MLKKISENLSREANKVLGDVFAKIEEVSGTVNLKLKTATLRAELEQIEKEIGKDVCRHSADFVENDYLKEPLRKAKLLEKKISEMEISGRSSFEEDTPSDVSHNFSADEETEEDPKP